MVFKDKSGINKIIKGIEEKQGYSPEEKRFMAYKAAIEKTYGKLGWRNRKRVGWCFENMTKTTFPSENFTGFRSIEHVHSSEVESSSSDNDSSVIDLSN